MRMYCLFVLSILVAIQGGCSRPNPAVCCTSPADCEDVGLPVDRTCGNDKVCVDHGCQPAECQTDPECPGARPICQDRVCVACDATHACPASAPVCELVSGSCGGCVSSGDCAGFVATPICNSASGVCVECVTSADCSGTTGACAGGVCRACEVHSDCESAACLGDGSCGSPSNTAYASEVGTSNPDCSKATPCSTIAAALGTGRKNLKLTGLFNEAVAINSRDLTIVADPGTRLTRTSPGPIILITGLSHVTISDIAVTGATNGAGTAVGAGIRIDQTLAGCSLELRRVASFNNSYFGIDVAQTCRLDLRDSIIANNFQGGVSLALDGTVINSLIVANGNSANGSGGIKLAGNVLFEFNTVVANLDGFTAGPFGIDCGSGPTMPTALIRNTIVSANKVTPSCVTTYSLFDAGTTVSGTDRAGAAAFKSTNPANPLAADFYRIGPTSTAIDNADPSSTRPTDVDGDERPQGPARDIGADELKL